MTDAILAVLEWINNMILGVGEDGGVLAQSMGGYMPQIFTYTEKIMQSIVMPVAYVILALFFLLELQRASTRLDASGGGNHMGAEMIFKILFKMVLCKIAIDSLPMILQAIYDITTYLTIQVASVVSGSNTVGGIDTAALEPMVDALSFWSGLICLILCFVVYLITMLAVAFANIIIVARFFELYVYFAVSPIPVATLPSDEMSQIGKGFLKSFAAVCFQGTIIFIVLSFYPVIFNQAFLSSSGADIFLALLKVLGYSVVLVLAVFSSGKWAKTVCSAM